MSFHRRGGLLASAAISLALALLIFLVQFIVEDPSARTAAAGAGLLLNIALIVACWLSVAASRRASERAQRAEEEAERAKHQAQEFADANTQIAGQLNEQRQLLDLVAQLETPAVPLAEGVLFTPIVGHIDTRRAEALTNRLLQAASSQRTRLVVLDISGVAIMDSGVALSLMGTAQALRLLGCEVAISGISAAVAMTLIQLGIKLEGVTTVRSPQEALSHFFSSATPQIKANGHTYNN